MSIIEIKNEKTHSRLRRIALARQGLLQTQTFGKGLHGALNAIQHLGYIQIDTISVVERAHHHVLYSRVPNFSPEMTNQLLLDKDIFEYWAHAAAFLPIDDYRFSLPYKQAIKRGKTHWYKNKDKKLMKELLARVRNDGPLRSRDLGNETSKQKGWWDWKPAKKALEQMYMEGDLMVCDRTGFQKTYDLTERVLPRGIDTRMPSIEEFAGHLIDQQLRCHGLVSLKGLTYLRRNADLKKAVKSRMEALHAECRLERVRLNTGEVFYIEAGSFESSLPRLSNRVSILSPFDNSVIQRDRLKALFQYEYLIECYVPEAKRQYGYFSLPLLFRDKFVGRMDCKAHRKDRHLEIKSLYLESHEDLALDGNELEAFIAAFAKATAKFCQFQGCDIVSLGRVYPQRLTQVLRDAIGA